MTALPERIEVMAMVAEAVKAGARQDKACAAISFSERTLQRWQRDGMRDPRPARWGAALACWRCWCLQEC